MCNRWSHLADHWDISTPYGADPNDAAAAFTEYAQDRLWIASHLLQLAGVAAMMAALLFLAGQLEMRIAGENFAPIWEKAQIEPEKLTLSEMRAMELELRTVALGGISPVW